MTTTPMISFIEILSKITLGHFGVYHVFNGSISGLEADPVFLLTKEKLLVAPEPKSTFQEVM